MGKQYQSERKQVRANPTRASRGLQMPPPALGGILGLQAEIGNQATIALMRKVGALSDEVASRSVALDVRRQLRSEAAATARPIQRLGTWAGDWTTDTYDLLTVPGMDGVDIKLRFKANDKVNAKEIGMLQTVKSTDKTGVNTPGANDAERKTYKSRNIPAGEAGEGTRTDRIAGERNPLYGTQSNAKSKSLVGSGAATYGNTHHGKHYKDKAGTLQDDDAWLTDGPKRSNALEETKMIFETTALAVAGKQAGTYYGSVQWGWEKDAGGTVTKLPFSVVSNDVPSSTFNAAAKQWNKSKNSAGKKVIPLPTAVGKYAKVDNTPISANLKQFGKLAKNTRLEMTDTMANMAKVTVIDGTFIGKVGWVKRSKLSDTRV